MKVNGRDIKDFTDAELQHTISDLVETINIQEESWRNRRSQGPNEKVENVFPKLGQYQDELHAATGEKHRREKLNKLPCHVVLLEVQTILQDLSQDHPLYNRIPWKRIEKALKDA